jgi:hypothetical protein
VDAESEIVTVPAPQPEPVGKGKPADVQRVVAKQRRTDNGYRVLDFGTVTYREFSGSARRLRPASRGLYAFLAAQPIGGVEHMAPGQSSVGPNPLREARCQLDQFRSSRSECFFRRNQNRSSFLWLSLSRTFTGRSSPCCAARACRGRIRAAFLRSLAACLP